MGKMALAGAIALALGMISPATADQQWSAAAVVHET
jgi:hypothetical protein